MFSTLFSIPTSISSGPNKSHFRSTKKIKVSFTLVAYVQQTGFFKILRSNFCGTFIVSVSSSGDYQLLTALEALSSLSPHFVWNLRTREIISNFENEVVIFMRFKKFPPTNGEQRREKDLFKSNSFLVRNDCGFDKLCNFSSFVKPVSIY